jgi:hypothetical protein
MIVAIFKIAFLLQELKVNIFDLITAYNWYELACYSQ